MKSLEFNNMEATLKNWPFRWSRSGPRVDGQNEMKIEHVCSFTHSSNMCFIFYGPGGICINSFLTKNFQRGFRRLNSIREHIPHL